MKGHHSGQIWGTIAAFPRRNCEQPQKSIAGVPAKLQIINLLNKSKKHSVVASLFCEISSGIVLWYTVKEVSWRFHCTCIV